MACVESPDHVHYCLVVPQIYQCDGHGAMIEHLLLDNITVDVDGVTDSEENSSI